MLKTRPVWKAAELKRLKELEEKCHYMGESHSGGDTLRLSIEDGGEWVAIMAWGGACDHLKRRDEHVVDVVSAVNVESDAPVSRKEGETGRCETPVGRRLLSETDLTDALVCSDALHCRHDTVWAVARSNGESLVQTRRQRERLSGPHKGEQTKVETSYHASTVEIDERHGADFCANAVRSEWAIETGCHGKRDFACCEDVRTRRCDANIIGAMMSARTPTFVFMSKRGIGNCQAFKEELQSDQALSLRMVVDPPSN